jgi:starch synthase
LAEAINRVLRDRDWARRLGLAGRKRVEEHFSWAAIAETTKKMYQQLLDERASASGQS